ncbi:MAG: carboxypeptidase regulatory-like domain-containing protein, partial [Bryobacteraceae bacterium]
MRRTFWTASRVILFAFAIVTLRAQNFGELTGTVSDATGAVVAGASVTAVNTGTSQARQATTNDTGNYSAPYLVPGNYDLRVEHPGFKTATRKAVALDVGAVLRIDVSLEIGEANQQVEVISAAPLLTTESTALGTVIDNKRIVDLPLNGRDYLQLVTLSPNVTTEGGAGGASGLQGGARSATSLSIAGQRLEFNRYTLDGVENTDPNFNSYIIHPSVDAVQEFKVLTGVYSAEFGRGASQINATTKSGTNEYHGTAFEFLRNSALDARQWGQGETRKNPFRRNDYGFTLGGPIRIPKIFNGKDRLFFLSNWEELRDRLTTQVTASVPTAAMRMGDFSGQNRQIFDPLTRVFNAAGVAVSASPFPGNMIPASRFSPAALKLLAYYPLPTVPGNNLNRNYVRNALTPTDTDQFNQRIDWNQNPKSNWFGRFSWGNDFQAPAATFQTDGSHTATTVRQAMISNTRILSNSTVNEARFAWNQFNNDLVG